MGCAGADGADARPVFLREEVDAMTWPRSWRAGPASVSRLLEGETEKLIHMRSACTSG